MGIELYINQIKSLGINIDNFKIINLFGISLNNETFEVMELNITLQNIYNYAIIQVRFDINTNDIKEVRVPYIKNMSINDNLNYFYKGDNESNIDFDQKKFIGVDLKSKKCTYYILQNDKIMTIFNNDIKEGTCYTYNPNELDNVCLSNIIKSIIIYNDVKRFELYYKNNQIYKYNLFIDNIDALEGIKKQIYEKDIMCNIS